MFFGRNLKYLRLKAGYSQEYIADKTNYKSYTTVQKWESGNSEPPMNVLRMLSDMFHVSMDDLMSRDLSLGISFVAEEPAHYSAKTKTSTIPVLGRVQAGLPIEAVENIIDYEEISEEMAMHGEYFGLQVKGSSMEPRFIEGDVVIIKKQQDIETGEIGIVLVNGSDATIKRISKHENGMSLIPLNASYAPKFYTLEEIATLPVQVIGKVVELRAKF